MCGSAHTCLALNRLVLMQHRHCAPCIMNTGVVLIRQRNRKMKKQLKVVAIGNKIM